MTLTNKQIDKIVRMAGECLSSGMVAIHNAKDKPIDPVLLALSLELVCYFAQFADCTIKCADVGNGQRLFEIEGYEHLLAYEPNENEAREDSQA